MTTTIASGVGGAFGYSPETTYGTYVAANHWLIPNSESLAADLTIVQGTGFANGQLVDQANRRVTTMQAAAGTVQLDVVPNAISLLLKQVFGTATAAQNGATTAYTHTYTLADTLGVSFSGQVLIPDGAALVHPYSFSGGKVTGAEFSCDQGGILGLSADMDFQQLSEVPSAATPSYSATAQPFNFSQETVKIGAIGSEAAIQGIRKIDLKIARQYDTSRFYANNLGLKSEPVTNGKVGFTGTLTTDLITKTDLYDKYPAQTTFSLVLGFTSTTLAGTGFPYSLTLTLPNCFLDGTSPQVSGLDVISGDLPFTCLTDSTHLPSAVLVTTDTTV